ncbi:hydrogenase expression/formation protein [Bradyrhizobium sp. NC92]|nr:hydrogenase expression/formation protein [Bradyrhizobium sp. NC92]UWU68158.1 hydrogenase expression/formation protein [Bradyrhizobium sp. NC92]
MNEQPGTNNLTRLALSEAWTAEARLAAADRVNRSSADPTRAGVVKAGVWIAPKRDAQPFSFVPVDAGNVDKIPNGRSAAGALPMLASLDGGKLARKCPNAIALLSNVAAAVSRQKSCVRAQLFRLRHLNELERDLVADVLGKGEVAGIVALPDGSAAQLQESVFAGIWHVRFEGEAAHEYVEIGAIPEIVRRAATDLTSTDLMIDAVPDGAMNVLPVLAEARGRALAWQPGMSTHIINLTLLPMNSVDLAFLQHSLGSGPVQLISRDYGSCRVQTTSVRNVWSVQFFNSIDSIILDTLEIGDVPRAVLAADEDLEDSAERLREIMEAYFR